MHLFLLLVFSLPLFGMQQSSKNHFQNISDELLLLILSYVPSETTGSWFCPGKSYLTKAMRTNRRFYTIANDEKLTKEWVNRFNHLDPKDFRNSDFYKLCIAISLNIPQARTWFRAALQRFSTQDKNRMQQLFYYACYTGNFSLLPDIQARDTRILATLATPGTFDFTPLFIAVNRGYPITVKKLLQREDLDPNRVGKLRTTYLIHAVEQGRKEVVEVLCEDPRVRINEVVEEWWPLYPKLFTALSVAQEKNFKGIERLLLSHGAVGTLRALEIKNRKISSNS